MIRSVFAVVLGFAVVVVLTGAAFVVLGVWGRDEFFNTIVQGFLLFYTLLVGVLGGYVSAFLSRRSPVLTSLRLGLLMVALSAALLFHAARGPEPFRFHVGLLLIALPSAAAGGYLRARVAVGHSVPQC